MSKQTLELHMLGLAIYVQLLPSCRGELHVNVRVGADSGFFSLAKEAGLVSPKAFV